MTGIVRQDSWDVASRLTELGLTQEELIDIVKACVAAQGGCTDNDPPNARGFESWRWGVRRAREILRQQGWEKDDTAGFCTVVNHDLKIRIAVMNADAGTGLPDRVPQNIARKGTNSERCATANRSLWLPGFEDLNVEDPSLDGYATWHLCVYIDPATTRAELSMLNEFNNGYFTDYLEKIIILGEGDWDEVDFGGDSEDDGGPEFAIEVTRK